MAISLAGGCLCGAVRFRAEADQPMAMHCYCKDCQRATGSAFATIVAVPESQFEVSGPVGEFAKLSDSGRSVTRSFCRECGSQLFSRAEAAAGSVFVKAGCLDDASDLQPLSSIWTKSRAGWAHLAGQLPEFEENPVMPG